MNQDVRWKQRFANFDRAVVLLREPRAKCTARPSSDVDLALEGIDDPLQAESIAAELDELPLPYVFDVQALSAIRYRPLREHIARVGVLILGPARASDLRRP